LLGWGDGTGPKYDDCKNVGLFHYYTPSTPPPFPLSLLVFFLPCGRQYSGSGSVSQRYGFGTFHHPAKIVRKTLISFLLRLLLYFLSLENDGNIPTKSNKQPNIFIVASWLKVNDEKIGIRICQRYGSANPDP
jgi:hypothetical protein